MAALPGFVPTGASASAEEGAMAIGEGGITRLGTTILVAAVAFWGIYRGVQLVLPRAWQPVQRREAAFAVVNYIHAVFGVVAGAVCLLDVDLWASPITSRSELLDVMCCVTLGYLVVDSLPLLLPGMLSHDPDSTEYHGFHMLIAVGFATYLANGTGGLVAAVGLFSELDTVLINQRQALTWLLRSGACGWFMRLPWRSILLVLDTVHWLVAAAVRPVAFLMLVIMTWRALYTAAATWELELPTDTMLGWLPGAPRLVVILAQVLTVHAAALYNCYVIVQTGQEVRRRWRLCCCGRPKPASKARKRVYRDARQLGSARSSAGTTTTGDAAAPTVTAGSGTGIGGHGAQPRARARGSQRHGSATAARA